MPVAIPSSNKVLRKRFGAWLQDQREAAGLSQVDLAATLDYAYPTVISQIERGVSALPPAELALWSEAIRVPERVVAEKYLYYVEPFLYAAIYGKDPYVIEKVSRPTPSLMRRTSRGSKRTTSKVGTR